MKNKETILMIDASSGISGDMFSAALLDLATHTRPGILPGWQKQLQAAVQNFAQPFDFEVEQKIVKRRGISANLLSFNVPKPRSTVNLSTILSDIKNSGLSASIQNTATQMISCLGKAEASIHGSDFEKVHLHEAGSEDSILDFLSAAILYHGFEHPPIYYSNLAIAGGGTTVFSHGEVGLPVPAVVEILRGFELTVTGEKKELVTPTGAAILKSLGASRLPDEQKIKLVATGYGAGQRELSSRPNVLRISLAEI